MSRRAVFKTYDQRTGRKIRGIDAVYDGEHTGLIVARGERDRPHPLSRTFVPPVDRAMLLHRAPEGGVLTTIINVGYEASSNLWEGREQLPTVAVRSGGGSVTYHEALYGFGEGGWGEEGYGGWGDELEVAF